MSGRPTRAVVEEWAAEVEAVAVRIGPRFVRSELRRRAVGYVRGLLGDAERKNGWQMAEHLGEATPDGVQHLLARAEWDADGELTDRARQRAAELAAGAELRTTGPAKRSAPPPVLVPAETEVKTLPFPADRRLPPPGSVLTRAYKGQTLQVRVLTNGFEYAGLVYPFLSAVAKAVTGRHCNGYLFFRLTKGSDA